MDWPRPSDSTRIGGAGWGGRLLHMGGMEPVCAARGDCLPGVELAGRLARRNAGTGAATVAAALRVLRGPHGRQLRSPCADGWAGLVGVYASRDCNRPAGWVPDAFDSVLPGDPRARRVPTIVLALWSDGVAHSAGGGQPGAAVEAARAFFRRVLQVVRRGRSNRPGRNDLNGGFLHRTEHPAALPRRENRQVRTRMGDNLMTCFRVLQAGARRGTALRWLKFNLVGALGIAVQLALLAGLKSG